MIHVRNLTRKYGDFVAVDSLSFEVPKGQIVGLLGHNGAGKTTTLRMLTGYLEPDEGLISIGNLTIGPDTHKIQNNLGYLAEQSPLYPEMSVQQYLQYVAKLRGIPLEKQASAIRQAIQATDLASKVSSYIHTLSKGYRQRVGVAQAIIHKPELLVLDEPTSGLDPSQILAMRDLIKNLAKSSTVILSTHIMQEVEAVCDRVVIMLNGRVALDSTLANLHKNNSINLSVDQSPDKIEPLVKKIKGVRSIDHVSTTGDVHSYKIVTKKNETMILTPIIAQKICEKGWKLYNINGEQRTLEGVFKEVNKAG